MHLSPKPCYNTLLETMLAELLSDVFPQLNDQEQFDS